VDKVDFSPTLGKLGKAQEFKDRFQESLYEDALGLGAGGI
jgi:hypothetical protein